MLKVKFNDIEYCRTLADQPTEQYLNTLADEYDYCFIVSYNPVNSVRFDMVEKKAAVIPLMGNIDEVFQRFHSTCKNEVRRSFKEENMEFIDHIQDWDGFYSFHTLCEAERNWKPAPREELESSMVKAIKYDGEYISGMSCYTEEKRMRIGRIFSRRRSEDFKKLSGVIFSVAARRIVYEFCQWGIANDKKTLDLGGIDPQDPSKKGISRFKMFFGSEIIQVLIGRYKSNRFLALEPKIKTIGIDLM